MTNDIKYIQATTNDVAILVNCHMSFTEEFHGALSPESAAVLRSNLSDFYTAELSKSYLSWYATVDGEIASVGGLCIRRQPGSVKNPSGMWGYLFGVYTLPRFRRKGLSRNIVDHLTRSAKEMGITALELHATKMGEPLYIEAGFSLYHEPTYRQYISHTSNNS